MYPDDSVQSVIPADASWWIENDDYKLCRGALIWAFVPHVDQVPYTFEPIGRTNPTEHQSATVRVRPLRVGAPLKEQKLPVAAMPTRRGEVWGAYRAKGRPCLVLGSTTSPAVEKGLTAGMPNSSTAPTIIVAPYYGADKQDRAGYNAAFIERVRHCEYPQFVWDKLPLDGGPNESILRLDQLQPIGAHYHSHKVTKSRLSEEALEIMDECLQWLIWGGVPDRGHIATYRELIEETFGNQ